MKLLLLIGNGAAGKMTVGQQLCKITPFHLFHNHVAIEPVLEVFGSFHGPAISRIREVFFEEFAKTDNYGLIFTYMWAFDMQSDWDYIEHVKEIFNLPEEDIYYVELLVPQQVRLERNRTENRLKNKASKRDIAASDARIVRDDENHRCESLPGEIPFPNYLRLDNSQLTAAEAAQIIKDHFHF
jgi:hypothetical protein